MSYQSILLWFALGCILLLVTTASEKGISSRRHSLIQQIFGLEDRAPKLDENRWQPFGQAQKRHGVFREISPFHRVIIYKIYSGTQHMDNFL